MKFKTWLEDNMDNVPASAEVIRTGLQPQVDADEINTPQKQNFNSLNVIQKCIDRIQANMKSLDNLEMKQLCQRFIDEWKQLNPSQPLGNIDPSGSQIKHTQRNQPLPIT
jgi:hypothetical protein